MTWARPISTSLAPLAVLIFAVFVLLFDPLGIEHTLAAHLSDWLRQSAPGAPPPHSLAAFRILETLWLLLFGAGAIVLLRFDLIWSGIAAVGGAALGFYLAWATFLHFGLLLDAATTGLALILVFTAAAGSNFVALRLARMSLRMAFAGSLPRTSIEKIARRPSLLKIDGEVRVVTYLVCGLRGLAELGALFRDDPTTFTRLMEQVLTPLTDRALAQGGVIDRLTADGFAAFWNAPLDDVDHAIHACDAASDMSTIASQINEKIMRQSRGNGEPLAPVEIGIGIATGCVIAGGFGGHDRMGYSVNGDPVTLAARIQGLSQQYGRAVIVSRTTKEAAARSFAFLEVDTIATGASDPPTALYAILGSPVVRASPKFHALTTFHDHIFMALRNQQWHQARALIEQCRKLSGASQKLYDLHLGRIGYFEQNPPGENWDGAFRPLRK